MWKIQYTKDNRYLVYDHLTDLLISFRNNSNDFETCALLAEAYFTAGHYNKTVFYGQKCIDNNAHIAKMTNLCTKANKKQNDLYGILQVQQKDARGVIKSQCAKLRTSIVLTLDKNVKNDCLSYKLELLNTAYKTLSNPSLRRSYDLDLVMTGSKL